MAFTGKTKKISFSREEREALQFVLDRIPHSMLPKSLVEKIDYLFLSNEFKDSLILNDEEIYTIRRIVPVDLLISRKPVGETIRKKMIEASLSFEFDFDDLIKRVDKELEEYNNEKIQ